EIGVRKTGHLRGGVTHPGVVLGQPTALRPPVALPHLRGILGETVQPAVLHTGDMPDHKADGVGFGSGAPGQFSRCQTLQGPVETPFTLIKYLFNEGFQVHRDSFRLGGQPSAYAVTPTLWVSGAPAH